MRGQISKKKGLLNGKLAKTAIFLANLAEILSRWLARTGERKNGQLIKKRMLN